MSIFIEIQGIRYDVLQCQDGNEYLVKDPQGRQGFLRWNGQVEIEPTYIQKIKNWINVNRRG